MIAPQDGRLHVYNETNKLVCFETGDLTGHNTIVFWGGMGAVLYSMLFLPKLSSSLPGGWSLVQPVPRSSIQGLSSAAGDKNIQDMHDLEEYFRQSQGKNGRMIYVGASIACNHVLRFFELYGKSTSIDSGILVSVNCGKEAFMQSFDQAELDESLIIASKQIDAGKGDFPFSPYEDNKITQTLKDMHARVFKNIMEPGGPAENFSSTSSDEELETRFASLRENAKNTLILMAGNDEAIPSIVNKDQLLARFLKAAQATGLVADGYLVDGANHNMDPEDAQRILVARILDFLKMTEKTNI